MRHGWQRLPFDEVIADETGGNIKTPQGDFLLAGKYPIVDQGKALMAGYSADHQEVWPDRLSGVIFGGHPRCFQVIDFPFCLGADGTKVLRPRIKADAKYLYHYL